MPVPRHWNLQPVETAPTDGTRVRLEADLASDQPRNAFNGPVYAVWDSEQDWWELSPSVEGTRIATVDGWWPDEDRTPEITLVRGEAPGTVGVSYQWWNGDSRIDFVDPQTARNAFDILGKTMDEDELAKLTVPSLYVAWEQEPVGD
jgi:hypothetical protein